MLTDILWEENAAALNNWIASLTTIIIPGIIPGSHTKKTYQLKLINQ